MYEQILVPLKWDRSDEALVEHVGVLARLGGGHVTLLHVVHSHSRDESAYLEEKARGYLAGEAAKISAQGFQVSIRVVQGEPADGITAVAREIGADLIAMATHGHGEMRHVIVGSVTEDVIRRSVSPVLLVRPSAATP
jgi:nucleotide-binding universal stress UspA family protein